MLINISRFQLLELNTGINPELEGTQFLMYGQPSLVHNTRSSIPKRPPTPPFASFI